MTLCPILKSIGHSEALSLAYRAFIVLYAVFETVAQSKTENETEHTAKEAYRCSR